MSSAGDPASILQRLKGLHPKLIDLSLGRVLRLLDRLGNPQQRLPPVVHVAGTNGKGSTVAFLRAVLAAHGRSTHVYTSPHLVRFNERIVVAGRQIDDASLAEALQRCETANAGEPITFFEITTAAAFLAFSETKADFTLLETGLGGRLDATNVIGTPAVSVITPISIDHCAYLGETLSAIAGEKAGILKPGVPCVVAGQEAEAQSAVERRAVEIGAPLVCEGRDWQVDTRPDGMTWRRDARAWTFPQPSLAGRHQQQNAALAITTCDVLPGLDLDTTRVAAGLGRGAWPARLQRLTHGGLARLLPDDWELWLDGGHNPGAALVLAEQLRQWRDRPCYAVIGMLETKDASGFLAPLVSHMAAVVTVCIPDEPAAIAARALGLIAKAHSANVRIGESVTDALRGLAHEKGPARVLICGSLYLAGHVLAENDRCCDEMTDR